MEHLCRAPATDLSPPAAREGAGMTYDAASDRVILFGGQDNNGYFNDTWQLISTPTPTPSPTATLTPTPTPSATLAPRVTPGLVPRHILARRHHDPAFVGLLPRQAGELDGIIPVNSIHISLDREAVEDALAKLNRLPVTYTFPLTRRPIQPQRPRH
jgi:Galactose oxidase, central domain